MTCSTCRLVLAVTVALASCLAGYFYTPVPDGMVNGWRVQLRLFHDRLYLVMNEASKSLGYGSLFSHIEILQKPLPTGDPPSAAYVDVKTTRVIMSGVSVLVYQPLPARSNSPGLIHIHGGGFIVGDTNEYDSVMYKYMKATGAVIFGIDYRKVPQHNFPVPIYDCLATTRFILRHGADYGADVTNIGLIGDSAGGNLAAAVTLNLTRESLPDLPALKFQVLVVPMLQAVNFNLPSFLELEGFKFVLTANETAALWAFYMFASLDNIDRYSKVFAEHRHISPETMSKYSKYVHPDKLPEQFRKPRRATPAVGTVSSEPHDEHVAARISHLLANPNVCPLLAEDLSGQPPTLVHVADFDVLRDDGVLYHGRLREQGVDAELIVNKGGFHGDFLLSDYRFLVTDTSMNTFRNNVAYINRMFKNTG